MKSILVITIINIIFIFNYGKSQEAIFPLIDIKCGVSLLDLKFENINIDTLQLNEHINQLQEDNYALSFINCEGSKLFTEKVKGKHFYSIKIQSHDSGTVINFIEELSKFQSIGHVEFNSMNLNLFNLDNINLPNINGIKFSNCKEINSNLKFINQFKDITLEKSYFNFSTNIFINKKLNDRSVLLYIEDLDDLMNMNYFSDLDYLSIIVEKSFKSNLEFLNLDNNIYKHKVSAKRFCLDNKFTKLDSLNMNFILNFVSFESIEIDNVDIINIDLNSLIGAKDILFYKCNIGNDLDKFLKINNLEEISLYYSKISIINLNSIKESQIKVVIGSKNEVNEDYKKIFENIEKELIIHNSKIAEENYKKTKK